MAGAGAEKARILVDLLAKDMMEHLAIVNTLSELARRAKLAVPSASRAVAEITVQVRNLSLLRDSMARRIELLVEIVREEELPWELVREIYALSGYYVEAGSRTEEEVLKSLVGFGASSEDLAGLQKARALASILYGAARERYRRGQRATRPL